MGDGGRRMEYIGRGMEDGSCRMEIDLAMTFIYLL